MKAGAINPLNRTTLTLILTLLAALTTASGLLASPDAPDAFTLDGWTLDGGGGTAGGGAYVLAGTIGQTDAGTVSGGRYVLVGGFWGMPPGPQRIFLPLVVRA